MLVAALVVEARRHHPGAGVLTAPDAANAASRRVLEKNGFERIGLARSFLRIDDEWRDFLLFQRLADD